MQENPKQEIALCGAPPGGCGFRGRNWRSGQLVAGYSTFDGAPRCACGSEMRAFAPRRFVAVTKENP